MTPLQFEALHEAEWVELASALAGPNRWGPGRGAAARPTGADAARLALLYRRCCEHLALARERSYPLHITERLDALAHRAHQHIYRQPAWPPASAWRRGLLAFPRAVRAQWRLVLLAALVFLAPAMALGLWCAADPGAILTVLDAGSARNFERMYDSERPGGVGALRHSGTDWQMFGFYIFNNIRVAFQCFASGLLAGVGSLFYLAYNGALGGAVGGYLSARGHGLAFWSFVVTHAAFELTAIVLSGAAGLRLGQSWLMPGRLRRTESLRAAATQVLPLLYGVIALLVIAAAFEAFWSPAAWVPPTVKFAVGGLCWALVLAFLLRAGRQAPDGMRSA
jgi:uncharacterized membrane protein SpoIIM required for sporulation